MSIWVREMGLADRSIWAEMRQQLFDDLSIDAQNKEIDDLLEDEDCRGYIALDEDQASGSVQTIAARVWEEP